MSISAAPLEGIVVVIVDGPEEAPRIERALSQAGAAAFTAHDGPGVVALLKSIEPHFAVIDPAVAGSGGAEIAGQMFFERESCRVIVYSRALPTISTVNLRWLVDKQRPVSEVVDVIIEAVRDPMWVRKGGQDLKPD